MSNRSSAARITRVLAFLIVLIIGAYYSSDSFKPPAENDIKGMTKAVETSTGDMLASLPIKGRAPRTGYERELFSAAWAEVDGCDMRNFILQRDLTDEVLSRDNCTVLSGTLNDSYSGKQIQFLRGTTTSDDVQIDHVVALSDAWQKGAQQITELERYEFANDPLNLQATDGPTNQQKSDSDAASWLPSNASFRCTYVTRQVEVKYKYKLWMTRSEYEASNNVLKSCD